jgi:hypothetical protein
MPELGFSYFVSSAAWIEGKYPVFCRLSRGASGGFEPPVSGAAGTDDSLMMLVIALAELCRDIIDINWG